MPVAYCDRGTVCSRCCLLRCHLVHSNQKVDVVESRCKLSFPPIFHLHPTQLMNFLTADTLFAAYPPLTAAKRGVLNPMPFAHGNAKIPGLNISLKYIDRGYPLQPSVTSCMTDLEADEDELKCGRSISCAETERSSNGHGHLWIGSLALRRTHCNQTRFSLQICGRWGGRWCSLLVGCNMPCVQTPCASEPG